MPTQKVMQYEVINEELGQILSSHGETAVLNAWYRVEKLRANARKNNQKRQQEIKAALAAYRSNKYALGVLSPMGDSTPWAH